MNGARSRYSGGSTTRPCDRCGQPIGERGANPARRRCEGCLAAVTQEMYRRRAGHRVSRDLAADAAAATSGRCAICDVQTDGRPFDRYGHSRNPEIDHIVPIIDGGQTEPGNLRLLCRRCNRSKGHQA